MHGRGGGQSRRSMQPQQRVRGRGTRRSSDGAAAVPPIGGAGELAVSSMPHNNNGSNGRYAPEEGGQGLSIQSSSRSQPEEHTGQQPKQLGQLFQTPPQRQPPQQQRSPRSGRFSSARHRQARHSSAMPPKAQPQPQSQDGEGVANGGLPLTIFGVDKVDLAAHMPFVRAPPSSDGQPSLSDCPNAGYNSPGAVDINKALDTMSVHMHNLADTLSARNFQYTFSPQLYGHHSLAGDLTPRSDATPRSEPSATKEEKSPRDNRRGGGVSQFRQKPQNEKARRQQKKSEKKKKRLMEKNRKVAEQERKWMNEEEWRMERSKWWGQHVRDGSWRTVRVFISSTFNDMHGERDALTRVVFPALNNKAKSRRVRVVPVDLRWGLTSEDTSDSGLGALEHCLLEIDNSRPFFVVLRGERYGWIPPNYRVSDRPQFDWIKHFEPGHSITAVEIYHGFLRKPFTPVHALCYERDSAFIDDVPTEKERKIFAFDYPNNPEVKERRDKLINDIRNHQYAKSRSYPAQYGGMDEEGKALVTGLEEFERMIMEDLWEAIKQEFPPPPPPPSELALERSYHNHFVEERSRQFIGRKALMNELEQVANSSFNTDSLPFIVVGAPGSGKTSLVTSFAKYFGELHPRVFVLVHVVSASPTSTDIRETLLRLCRELVARFEIEDLNTDSDDYQTVKENFALLLERAGHAAMNAKTHILLVLDAINQFNPFYGAHTMDWLPAYMPAGVRAILSTTPDAQCLTALQKRDPKPPQLDVPPLEFSERCDIVRNALAEYRKKLLPTQMNLLMEKSESHKPLYLLTVCEELRLQAQYGVEGSGVDRKIKQLPGEIPTLLDVVLERVERDLSTWAQSTSTEITPAHSVFSPDTGEDMTSQLDNGHLIVRDALTLLECSRHGLRENELLELLAPPGKSQLPPVVWARLYRSLELYLRPLGEEDEGMLGFFHQQMMIAVRRRYLQDNRRAEAEVCGRLTEYFFNKADPTGDGQWLGDQKRYFLDLVYYQLRALDLSGLRRTLGDLLFIQRRAEQGVGSMEHLLRDYYDAQEELRTLRYSLLREKLKEEQGASPKEEEDFSAARSSLLQWIGEFLVFVSSHHSTLTSYPKLTFQYALNQPDSSTPFQTAEKLVKDECDAILEQLHAKENDYRELTTKVSNGAQENDSGESDAEASKKETKNPSAPKQGGVELKQKLDHICDNAQTQLIPRRFLEWSNKPQRNRMVADFAGYNYEVSCISLNPDSSLIAIGFKSGTIQIIDADIGEMIRELSTGGHSAGVTCLAFSSDGLRLISGSYDTNAVVWDALTGSLLSTLVDHSGTITSVAWLESDTRGRRSRTVATAGLDSVIRVWEEKIQTDTYGFGGGGEDETRYEIIWDQSWLQSPIMAMKYNQASKCLAAGHADGQVQLWDAHAPNLGLIQISQFTAHRYMQAVSTISLSPDGSLLATGSLDQTVKLWEKRMMDTDAIWKPMELQGKGHNGAITCLDFSPDGHKLVTASLDKKLLLWDVTTGKEIVALNGHADAVYSAEFTHSGDRVVSGSYDKTVKTWDVEGVDDYGVVPPVKRADHQGNALKSPSTRRSFVPRRRRLGRRSSQSRDLPPLSTKSSTENTPSSTRSSNVFFRDSSDTESPLAQSRFGSTSELLNANDLGIPSGAHAERVTAATVNYGGTFAATGSTDKTMKIWDLEKVHEKVVLVGHNSSITALAFIGEDEYLVSGDGGGNIMVWDGNTFDHQRTIHAHSNVAVTSMTWCDLRGRGTDKYSGDLLVITGAADGTIKVFVARDGFPWEIQPPQCFPRLVEVSSLRYVPATRSKLPLDCTPTPVNSGHLSDYHLKQRTAKHSEEESRQIALRNLLAKALKRKSVTEAKESDDRTSEPDAISEYQGIINMMRMYLPSFVPSSEAIANAIPKTMAYKLHEEATKNEKKKRRKKKKDVVLDDAQILEDVRTLMKEFVGTSGEESEQLLQTWEDDANGNGVDPPASVAGVVADPHERDRVICVGSSGQVCVLDLFSMAVVTSTRLCDPIGGSVKLSAVDPLGARISAAARTKSEPLHTIVSPTGNTENRVSLVMDLQSQNENEESEAQQDAGLKPKEVVEKERQEKFNADLQKRIEKVEQKKKEREERKARKRAQRLKQSMLSGEALDDSDSSDEGSEADTGSDTKGSHREDQNQENSVFRQLVERSHYRTCSSMAFSHDGSLIACGSSEKVISLVDSSRPHLGPLAQFLAFGEVTAIAVGPGVLPWDLSQFKGSNGTDGISMLDLVFGGVSAQNGAEVDEEPDDIRKCSTSYLEEFVANQEKKLSSLIPRACLGNGQGCLGLLIAGDSTGAVFILRLQDIIRRAEADYFSSLLERERSRRQQVLDEALEELQRRQLEKDDAKQSESGQRHAAPLQTLTFANGRQGVAAYLPRVLHYREAKDVQLCNEVIASLGIDLEGLDFTTLIPVSDSTKLAEAFLPRRIERGEGMIRVYRKLKDSGEPISSEDEDALQEHEEAQAEEEKKRSEAPSESKDRGMSERIRKVEELRRQQKLQQEAEEAREKAERAEPLREEYFHRPKALVCVFGGAAGLHDLLVPGLKTLIQKGAVAGAVMAGAMILDGGTDAGVMSMIGSSLEDCPERTMRLLGIVPGGVVKLPGDEDLHKSVANKAPLESHHSNFAIVPSKEWGGETTSMFTMMKALSRRLPTIAILANGGFISKKEIISAVRQSVPVIVISGSGRLADKITLAIRGKTEGDEKLYREMLQDDEVRDIVLNGEIYLYRVTDPPQGLQELVCDLVSSQRDRMLADSFWRNGEEISEYLRQRLDRPPDVVANTAEATEIAGKGHLPLP
eukprot:gb/GECG01010455.1/.p1 GENE.gb/GECG01010455.1/~~gb/GECG01010455.1/.p1  ORF type:complete len:2817 (+),score=410.58 gb/GECG01010455.1/:1-8451(+)